MAENNVLGSIVSDAVNSETRELKIGAANIKVIGVGGAGNNMVSWLTRKGITGADTVVVNTDKQHLDISEADSKVLIGKSLTRGLGCGGFPNKGREAVKEDSHEIKGILSKADMAFICAGLGGGTGTGAAPVIAGMAKEQGAIVIGTVTMPFNLERARLDKAEMGLDELRNACDTVIVIDNNRLVQLAGQLPIQKAFAVANELVSTMIKGIVEIIAVPSLVNLDYADVKAIMTNGDVSVIAIGESDSENRIEDAVKKALNNPLLNVNYEGATGALIHISGGNDLTLEEVNRAGELITKALHPEANVIWGARICEELKSKVRIMSIVTGVNSPYVLGKIKEKPRKTEAFRELGIDITG